MEISVVIPCYNEQAVIADTIQEVKSYLTGNFSSFEIIVVDDGSSDDSLKILQAIPGLKILRNLRNHGKGYTVRKGALASTGDWILFMDADSSTAISELRKLSAFQTDYQVIIGSRALPDSIISRKQPIWKVALGRAGNKLIRVILGLPFKDTQCGFKLFNAQGRKLFAQLTTAGWGFDFELMLLAKRAGLAIKEVPITWNNNFDSKVTLGGYLKTFYELFKIRFTLLNTARLKGGLPKKNNDDKKI